MELKYIFYITVNLCNGKFYFGIHRTNPNKFDGYIGDGIYRQCNATKNYPFHRAVRKYGYENFKRTTIKIFPDTEEGFQQALSLEKEIVNETLLRSKMCYNSSIGGRAPHMINTYKRVYLFALNGNYLRSFSNAREAAIWLNIPDEDSARSAIKNCCLGTTQSAYGYFWSYTKKFTYNNYRKKVAQYSLTGKFIRYFDSINEAEAYLQINSIHQAIAKKYSCAGYQWRYYDGDQSDIEPLVNNFCKNKVLPILMESKDGSFKKIYNSIEECVKENSSLTASQINRVLKRIIKSHKGFYFKYIDSQDKDIV